MFLAEGALAGYANFHRIPLPRNTVTGLAQSSLPGPAWGCPLARGGWLPIRKSLVRSSLAPVLENDVPDGGVRRRHSVEAVDLLHLVLQRSTHEQPQPPI